MNTPLRAVVSPLALAILALSASQASAVEGMWMPQQLPTIAKQLKATGLAIDPAKLSKLTEFPMGAVVSLGGCTASFVSPQGLVVTNHHCAYGSIQYNSQPQKDLIKSGFLAQSFEEELPAAPGSRVFVTEEVKDVTALMLDEKVRSLKGKARVDAMEANSKRLVSECEQGGGYRCTVSSFYGGAVYQLIKQMEIKDVRLVHAPADMVGRFGGDTDNWMWPRHTGDYSFYRAYVGPDGKPAEFNKANKPYAPKHFLKLASSPLKEGDFVMVTGYPGRTNRLRLPAEVDFTFSWQRPTMIKAYGDQLDIIRRETAGRRDAEIKLANRVAGLGNAHKNWQGQQASYEGSDILARKKAAYDELKAWVNADAKRAAEFGPSLANVEKLLAEAQADNRRDYLLSLSEPGFLGVARSLYENAIQRELPNEQRKPGFQDRDQARIAAGLKAMDRRYDAQVEVKLNTHFLAQYLAQPKDQLNADVLSALKLQPGMTAQAIEAQLTALNSATTLAKADEREAWVRRDVAAFKASQDPYIQAAVALYTHDRAEEAKGKERAGLQQEAYAGVMRALMAFKAAKKQPLYPDANGTLRVSFGKVQGRNPGGADGTTWTAFTTLNGILEKHKGEGDFDAPAVQREAIKARRFDQYAVPELGSVPVNFLSTLDTTGGNSGSPVLNKNAELVGLLFDGTLDGVISDWDFNDRMNRSIVLDARYMLWQMKVVDKAERLLKEMGAK
ncbi:MAG: S46 family peptidase [Burkholderiaceae bacterium]|nr:MAG: S46 family peptidase [Burkholderiaceae bacterium]